MSVEEIPRERNREQDRKYDFEKQIKICRILKWLTSA